MLSFFAVLSSFAVKCIQLLVAYVSNNAFPMPLSEKEEQVYLDRLQNGDEEARAVLVERNLRLVAHIVKKFDNSGEEMDDLISIGTIGLIKAINTYDQSKKTRLATYAARCIENEILMYFRSTRRIRSEVSLYDPIGVDKEGNELTLTVYLFRPFSPGRYWLGGTLKQHFLLLILGAWDAAPACNRHRAGAFLFYIPRTRAQISAQRSLQPGQVTADKLPRLSPVWE